ncbi:uncharacterized protein LOC118448605 [Vespa mandarinia]|uniref:uncharacterized protein LOC118448605 n=1 Tax=Vespa mandarinia TaxID=7446 RepID=UPI00160F36DA|nr:uncharacterized protein LOC118448605 [Vespa mandarinia]
MVSVSRLYCAYFIVFSKTFPVTGCNKKQFECVMKEKRRVLYFLQFSSNLQIYQNVPERSKLLRTAFLSYKPISSIIDWFAAFSKFERAVVSCFYCNNFFISSDCVSALSAIHVGHDITSHHKIFSNSYVFLTIFPCILNIFFYIFGKLDDNELKLPLSINNVLKPGALYYSLLIYQVILIFLLITVASLFISMYLIFVQHACSQFSVIMLKIRQPFKKDQKYIKSSWYYRTSREEYDWIVDIIKRYTKAIEFVDLLNKFSNRTYIIICFFAMLIVIFDFLYMFQLSEILHNVLEIIDCCIIIVGTIVILYLNFYVGQKLLDHGNAIFEELRQVPFNNLTIKTQKMLLFVIARSMKPCVLSIGGIFISSHEVFSMLIQKPLYFFTMYLHVIPIAKRGQIECVMKKQRQVSSLFRLNKHEIH